MKRLLRSILPSFALAVVYSLVAIAPAHATSDFSTVSENMVESVSQVPGLITGLSYILGLLFAVTGLLKIKEHVERPGQVQLGEALVRFLVGGALFSLPIIYQAMAVTIGSGNFNGTTFSIIDFTSSVFAAIPGALTSNINGMLSNIITSVEYVPYMLAAVAYLLGLILGISGILKVKEHVENPNQVQIREPIIRFLIGGALFALPSIMSAMQETIAGDPTAAATGSVLTTILSGLSGLLGGADCTASSLLGGIGGGLGGIIGAVGGGGSTVGDAICSTMAATTVLPFFMTSLSYLFGIILAIWGLLKIKDHVISPTQTPLWDGVIRLIAGGAFFSLPFMVSVVQGTIGLVTPLLTTGFNGTATGNGLDAMMTGFMDNIYGPMIFVMNFFGYIAGTALVMIGISRLLKSSQEGPRGPGGLGTLMTFLVGGALISLSPMIASFTTSIFSGAVVTQTGADMSNLMSYGGLTTTETAHITAIISAILKFMIVLGIVSFARGLFIIREVAEGSQQASLMAGMTHLFGGALAVNLGPVLNAIQTTFNIAQYGISFT